MKKQTLETNVFERIKAFLIKYKTRYIAGFLVVAAYSILQLILPRVTGDLIDHINEIDVIGSQTQKYFIYLISIAIMLLLMRFLSRQILMKSTNLYAHIERINIFNKIVDLSMDFFNKRSTGEIMALSTNDINAIRHMLGRGILMLFSMFVLMISSVIIIGSTVNFKMALFLLLPMPFILLLMSRFGIIINKRFARVQQAFQEMTEKAQEIVSGIRVVKAFVQEEHENENFGELNRNNYDTQISLVKVQGIFSPLIRLLMDIAQFIVLFYGGKLVLESTITLGDFIALNSYVAIIMRPVRMIGNLITVIQRGRASIKRISKVLVQTPDIFDSKFKNIEKVLTENNSVIEFRELSFRYNDEQDYVLKNISIDIKEGKTLGILGRIGSGKSTLALLLLRLYETENRNEILIKGKDISEYSIYELRDIISYIPQENVLFSDSFKNNINFMPNEYSFKDIESAAKKAYLHETIINTNNGYETRLGERGINISGGEKQRLSIARALLKKSDILIMDDCLSAVDTSTERSILNSLRKERKDKVSIIISHRISTIQDSDEIIVLEAGEIIERGTHSSLLKNEGLYKRTYERQTLEKKIMNL